MLEMPSFKILLHCENGSPPYLTPILLAKFFPSSNRLVQNHLVFGVAVGDSFVAPEYGSRSSIKKRGRLQPKNKIEVVTNKPIGYTFVGKSVREKLHIPADYNVIACPSFDLIDDFGSANSKAKASTSNTEVTLLTPHGQQKLSPSLFRQVVKEMQVPACVGLYDQPASNNSKRTRKSLERTKLWTEMATADFGSKIWAPVIGGDDLSVRLRCIKNALAVDDIGGFALVGIQHIDNRARRQELLKRCMKEIPRDLPCGVRVSLDILQIIDAAASGVLYIGTALPTTLARSNKALNIDLSAWRLHDRNNKGRESDESERKRHRTGSLEPLDKVKTYFSEGGSIDLGSDVYVQDMAPLVDGCACLACSQHNRCYIHHLIKAKELLAEILLFYHNLHSLLEIFEEMSKAASAGMFTDFVEYVELQLQGSVVAA